MLRMNEQESYLISAKAYMFKASGMLVWVSDKLEEAFNTDQLPGRLKQQYGVITEHAIDIRARLVGNVSKHAADLAAHKRYMSGVVNKIDSYFMHASRLTRQMLNALDDENVNPEDNVKPALKIDIAQAKSICEEVMGYLLQLPDYTDYIDGSMESRQKRVDELVELGPNCTLSKITDVLRIPDIPSLSVLRHDLTESAVGVCARRFPSDLNDPAELTPDRVRAVVTDHLRDMWYEIQGIVNQAVSTRLIGDEPGEVGSFIKQCVQPAVNKAFKTGGRSGALNKINEAVAEYMRENHNIPNYDLDLDI